MLTINDIQNKTKNKWDVVIPLAKPTLQIFITSKCNLRCKGCFFENYLGHNDMTIDKYLETLNKYKGQYEKVILIGGEPTLNKDLLKMVQLNNENKIPTTIYTNGRLGDNPFINTSYRIGVSGFTKGPKPLKNIHIPEYGENTLLVYMLDKNNVDELLISSLDAIEKGCKKILVSSVVDIQKTGDFWKNGKWTLTHKKYIETAIKFVNELENKLDKSKLPEIHMCGRGMIDINKDLVRCRYINILPDGERQITCPFDISLCKTNEEHIKPMTRTCNKHSQCLLQKVILKYKG